VTLARSGVSHVLPFLHGQRHQPLAHLVEAAGAGAAPQVVLRIGARVATRRPPAWHSAMLATARSVALRMRIS
jgi:hypothetical protein